MSEIEYRILCYLRRESSPVLWCKILSDFCTFSTPTETDAVLKAMLFSGLLLTTSPTADPQLSSVVPSNSAILELLKEEDRRARLESIQQDNERKENEKQKAAENKERDRLNWEQSCKEAERKAEHAFQYKLTFLNAFLTFVFGLISGAILSNLDRLIPLFISLIH